MAKLQTPVLDLRWSSYFGYLFVSWDPVDGAELYTVYENGDFYDTFPSGIGGFTVLLPPPGNYEYRVVASGAGYEDSDPGIASITITVRLDPPENLQVSFSDNPRKVELTWDEVPLADSYTVFRYATGERTPTVFSVQVPYLEDETVEYDKTYYYSAAAESEIYDGSDISEEVSVTIPQKLSAPSGLQKSDLTENSVKILWNGVAKAAGYTIRRLTNGGDAVSFTTRKNEYSDSTISTGNVYTYSVSATGNGYLPSDESAPLNVRNWEKLATPQNLRRTSLSENSISIAWDAVQHAYSYIIHTSVGETYMAFGTFYSIPTEPGASLDIEVRAFALSGYYVSDPATITVTNNPRLKTPDISELSQTLNSITVGWSTDVNAAKYVFSKDGSVVYEGSGRTYTDSGLTPQTAYTYAVVAVAGTGFYDSLPGTVTIRAGREYTDIDRQQDYLSMLRQSFTKLCRLRFLNPNGTTAFALDNNPKNPKSRAFIADGTISGNWQNGQRYTASVTLDNIDGDFDFAVNKLWFGQEIAIDEGLLLSNGEEYYRQSGVFIIDDPTDNVQPNGSTVTYNLVDKWANLDGTLGGNLEGTYEVPIGTNIYTPIESLLSEDRGNGRPLDNTTPVFTEYYNGKTQVLPDGTEVYVTDSPYTLRIDGDNGTIAQVILGLAGMVNAWVGYDVTGALRVDPSQDDISDASKPVSWRFSQDETQLLGMSYTVKKEDVYNDYIVVGEQLDDNSQPGGRAQNLDPSSDTNINLIGRKTKRESASGYATVRQCKDLAEWRLKRSSILQKAVSISCSQMFHIDLNSLVEIVRTDKPGSPVERHLVQGFSRPLASSGAMTISATSVNDFAEATVTEWPPASES